LCHLHIVDHLCIGIILCRPYIFIYHF
jgi:hypothetical protein